ncbi:MAG: hypothetical protein KDA30_04430 [Phycisphaerales bacterium]|nr:hypothetical protein [Phycisphaerales bacterium]
MSQPNNPAGRLLQVLREAERDYDRLKGMKSLDAWSQLLCVPNHQRRRLINTIFLTYELPQEIERSVRASTASDPDRYLVWVKQFNIYLRSVSFESKFEANHSGLVDPSSLALLNFCDELLATNPEPVVDHDALLKLLDGIEGCVRDIQQSDLPHHVRLYLLRLLDLVADSIAEYRVIGIRAVAYCTDSVYGLHKREQGTWEQAKTTEIGDRVWDIMGKYATVVAVVESAARLGAFVQKFLPA